MAAGKDSISIQSEYTDRTSTQTIYPIEDRTEAATQPSDTSRMVLNTIGGEKWQTAGQWVRYNFTVSTSGMYNIATRYRQNVLDGMYVCRALYIFSDGVEKGAPGYYDGIPFKEASEFRFNSRCSPRGNPACRGTFGGRRKAVRDRFALQGGTGDFP